MAARDEEQARFRRVAAAVLVPGLALGAWLSFRGEGRLDPAEFRAPIVALETVLYGAAAPGPRERLALGDAARSLELAVVRTQPSAAQRRALDAVLSFTSRTWAAAYGGGPLDVVSLRREWEPLRGRYFSPAEWLRMAPAGLDEAQSAATGPPSVNGNAYQESLDNLNQVVGRLDFMLARLSEWSEEVPDRDLAREWDATRTEVTENLERIQRGFPAPPPPDADAAWKKAHQDLGKVHELCSRALRNDWRTSWLPSRAEGQQRTADLQRALNQARRSLEEAKAR